MPSWSFTPAESAYATSLARADTRNNCVLKTAHNLSAQYQTLRILGLKTDQTLRGLSVGVGEKSTSNAAHRATTLPSMPPPCDNPRDAALAVVHTLRAAGHTAYLAGGCVRDALLGLEPKDHDVATDATPDTVQSLFRSTAAVGAAFGVVLVYIPMPQRGRHTIEVATFRAEGAYSDGRRPDEVRFTTAEEDAKRRDFTINGLFADPPPEGESGDDTTIDFVGGQDDLKAGVIRAIGAPGARFGEDYLRMLRAVRFAARPARS